MWIVLQYSVVDSGKLDFPRSSRLMDSVLGLWTIYLSLLVELRLSSQDAIASSELSCALWYVSPTLCHFRGWVWELSYPDSLGNFAWCPRITGIGLEDVFMFSNTSGNMSHFLRWMVTSSDVGNCNTAQCMSKTQTIEACGVHHFNNKLP